MKITKSILLSLFFISIFSSASFAQDRNVKLPYLCIRGIVFNETEPMAIINEKFVGEGELVLGAKVMKIAESTVEFEYAGEVFVKEVGDGCRNIVAPSDTTFYLGERREDLQDIITRMISLQSTKGAPSRKEVEELQQKIANYFNQNMAMVITVVLLLVILPYIYCAVTLQMIATKTGTENAWLAWIPIGNTYLECIVAGKPGWWVLMRLFVVLIPFAGPIITIFITVIVWMGISEARQKPTWLGILSVIPPLNLVLMGYLAFAKGETISEKKKEQEEKSAIDIGIAKHYNK